MHFFLFLKILVLSVVFQQVKRQKYKRLICSYLNEKVCLFPSKNIFFYRFNSFI